MTYRQPYAIDATVAAWQRDRSRRRRLHDHTSCPAGEQKEYKEVEKIVHKEVIKEVTVGVSEEELSKARDRVEIKQLS